jgi:hypothetical protein
VRRAEKMMVTTELLQAGLDDHRNRAGICCPADCMCWDIENLLSLISQLPSSPSCSALSASSPTATQDEPEHGSSERSPTALLASLKEFEEKVFAMQEELAEGNSRSYFAGMTMAYKIAQETIMDWLNGGLEKS